MWRQEGSSIRVRSVTPEDADAWLRLRSALWPEGPEAEHREEIARFFAGDFPREPWEVLVAEDSDGRLSGLAELSVRPYAEGCRTHRVAYLEGWFVAPEARGRGIGAALIAAAEVWGQDQGCSEFASDADPDNQTSRAAHRAVGFEEVGMIRCFRKAITSEGGKGK